MGHKDTVQKLWNYYNGPGCGQSHTRSPAYEHAGIREKPRLTLRDDGMSYGDCLSPLLGLPLRLFCIARLCKAGKL